MMLTPNSSKLKHRLRRSSQKMSRQELARQLLIRTSTLEMYQDASSEEPMKCSRCSGTSYAPSENLIRLAAGISQLRPAADTLIDQCSLIDIDLARRVQVLLDFHDLPATAFAFVGDDDLASLLLSRVGAPGKVLVLDVDRRILDTIRNNFLSRGTTKFTSQEINLARLAENAKRLSVHSERYDVVVTDPPYAEVGMLTFLYTATFLLKLGGQLYLAVPYLLGESWTDDLMQTIQVELLKLGFVITLVIPGFFAYNESDVLSALVVATKRRNAPLEQLFDKCNNLNLHRFYTTRQAVL